MKRRLSALAAVLLLATTFAVGGSGSARALGALSDAKDVSKSGGGAKSGGSFAVRAMKDIAYYDGADADPIKHKLNLYLPQGATNYPVVLFVHGGGWRFGDRNFLFDLYGKLGGLFAKNGVGLAVASYRLSPGVKHPEHAKDVARAFAWVKKHVGEYGAASDQLFVAGHSAGGHLVALLGADEKFLAEHGLSAKAIRGVIGISGVYDIDRDRRFFPSVFGTDENLRREASPLQHVKAEMPPFLLLYGSDDFPTLDVLAVRFHKALRAAEVEAEILEVKKRDHFAILGRMLDQEDPGFQAILAFIAKHSNLELKP